MILGTETETTGSGQAQDTLQGGAGAGADAAKEQREKQLQQQLQQTNTAAVKNALMVELMRDPDFSQVFQAKAAGKKFKLQYEGDDSGQGGQGGGGQQQQPQQQKPLEEMTEAEKMQHLMSEISKNTTSTILQQVKQMFEPLQKQITDLSGFKYKQEVSAAEAEVNAVKAKYPDFDQYGEQILAMSEKNPNLGAEDLYILAKAKSGGVSLKEAHAESERPTSTSARFPNLGQPPSQQKAVIAPGVQGLRNAILASAKRAAAQTSDADWGE